MLSSDLLGLSQSLRALWYVRGQYDKLAFEMKGRTAGVKKARSIYRYQLHDCETLGRINEGGAAAICCFDCYSPFLCVNYTGTI